jgi:hypothetical protein
LTTNTTFNYPTPAPTFSPGGEPPLNTAAAVNQTITVSAIATCPPTSNNVVYTCNPTNPQGLRDFHDAETDAYGLYTNNVTTDAYVGPLNTAWVNFGTVVNDGAGDTYYTSYTPGDEIDLVQDTAATTWTNSTVATSVDILDGDGTPTEQNAQAGGSYVETLEVLGGYYLGLTLNADGSGTYGGGQPFSLGLGAGANNLTTNASNTFAAWDRHYGLTFSSPGPTNVTILEIASPAPAPVGTATARPTATPAVVATPLNWYTTPLHTENDALTLSVTLPGGCSVPAQFGTTGNKIVQTTYLADPVLGYAENETITTYIVNGYGPVCIVLADTQKNFYDFNSDFSRGGSSGTSFAGFFQGGGSTPMSTETISETLTLQSATGSDVLSIVSRRGQSTSTSTSRSTSSITSTSSQSNPLVVGAAAVRFNQLIQHERIQRERAFTSALQRIATRNGGI